jgi:HAMP domain-containing protein
VWYALCAGLQPRGSVAAMGVLLASWAVSLALALLFQRWVEAPLSRLVGYRRKSAT